MNWVDKSGPEVDCKLLFFSSWEKSTEANVFDRGKWDIRRRPDWLGSGLSIPYNTTKLNGTYGDSKGGAEKSFPFLVSVTCPYTTSRPVPSTLFMRILILLYM